MALSCLTSLAMYSIFISLYLTHASLLAHLVVVAHLVILAHIQALCTIRLSFDTPPSFWLVILLIQSLHVPPCIRC